MPSKVDILAIVNDEIFCATAIAGSLICTIDDGMKKVVVCGHVCDIIAVASAPVFLREVEDQ